MAGEHTSDRRETRSTSGNTTLDLLKDLLTPNELSTLSNDSKLLFKAIDKSLTMHIKTISEHYDEQLILKEAEIKKLNEKVAKLESNNAELNSKVSALQNDIDAVDQYERRDSLILSGNAVPSESDDEDSVHVVMETIRTQLNIPITEQDINVAHRLGRQRPGRSRPLIVKFMSRTKKSQVVRARISLPKPTPTTNPAFFINESLTPIRRTLFYQMRQIRKNHKTDFKQLYTQDGKITVKLNATNDRKHVITNKTELEEFLKVSPAIQDTYNRLFNASSS